MPCMAASTMTAGSVASSIRSMAKSLAACSLEGGLAQRVEIGRELGLDARLGHEEVVGVERQGETGARPDASP